MDSSDLRKIKFKAAKEYFDLKNYIEQMIYKHAVKSTVYDVYDLSAESFNGSYESIAFTALNSGGIVILEKTIDVYAEDGSLLVEGFDAIEFLHSI